MRGNIVIRPLVGKEKLIYENITGRIVELYDNSYNNIVGWEGRPSV